MSNIIIPMSTSWPPNRGPLTEIQSYTYEDALTLADVQGSVVKYIKFTLVPYLQGLVGEINELNAGLISDVTAKLEEQTQEITDKLAAQAQEVADALAAQNIANDLKISQLEQFVNEQVQLIINDSIQVQDPVMAGIVGDTESLTRKEMDDLYTVPMIYAKKYGIKDDGTDQAANIEAFLTDAKAKGAIAVMERGKVITVNRPIIYNGAHWDLNGCTLKAGANITSIVLTPGYNNPTGETVIGGNIIGGLWDLNTKAHSGIWLVKAEGVTITKTKMINPVLTSSSFIRLNQNTVGCTVSYTDLTNPIDDPIGVYPSMSGISCTSDVVDPQSGGQNATLTFQDPTNVSKRHQIFGNVVRGGTHGISLYGAENCNIHDNDLDNFSHRGIILSPRSRFNRIVGNSINDFGSTGIHLAWGSDSNIIMGNTLRTTRSATEGDGIKGYFGCSNNIVSNNIIYGVKGSTTGAGIRFAVGSVRNMIIGNKINDSNTGIRLDSKLGGAYYNPASVGHTSGTVIADNMIVGIVGATGIIFNTFETPQIVRTVMSNNNIIFCGVGVQIIENTGVVGTITAVGNSIDATTKFDSPRVAAHFASSSGNEGIPDVSRSPFMQISESAEPLSPATSDARLYVDSVAGKRRLMVKFSSGAAQQISSQP